MATSSTSNRSRNFMTRRMAGDASQVLSLDERAKHLAETGLVFPSDTKNKDATRLVNALSNFQQKQREEIGDHRCEEQVMREEIQIHNRCSEVHNLLEGYNIDVLVHIGFPPDHQNKPSSYLKRGIVIRGTKEAIEKSTLLLQEDSFQGETRRIPYNFHVEVEEEWTRPEQTRRFMQQMSEQHSMNRSFGAEMIFHFGCSNPFGNRDEPFGNEDSEDHVINLDEIADEHDLLNKARALRALHLIRQAASTRTTTKHEE